MKIAFLNIYNGVIDRGAETFVKELANNLTDRNEVFVFQSGKARGNEKYKIIKISTDWNWSTRSDANTIAGKLLISYWARKIAFFSLKVIPYLLKYRFDIVVPINGGWMSIIVRIVTWLYGGKMVVSGQAGIGWADLYNLRCFPNAFIALSSQAKDWAKKENSFVSCKYIPNGADLAKFSPKGAKFKTKLSHPIILCVAALVESKRIDLVIKAVQRFKNASLLIVGNGNQRNKLKKMAEKMLGNRFEIVKVPFEKIPAVYRTVDVFTLASCSFYSFEIVLVEAMASGLPVVANNDSIRKEIIGPNGIYVNPLDTEAYFLALKKALKTKPNFQIRAKSFEWKNIAKKYETVFRELLR